MYLYEHVNHILLIGNRSFYFHIKRRNNYALNIAQFSCCNYVCVYVFDCVKGFDKSIDAFYYKMYLFNCFALLLNDIHTDTRSTSPLPTSYWYRCIHIFPKSCMCVCLYVSLFAFPQPKKSQHHGPPNTRRNRFSKSGKVEFKSGGPIWSVLIFNWFSVVRRSLSHLKTCRHFIWTKCLFYTEGVIENEIKLRFA